MAYGNNCWSSEALGEHLRELEALASEGSVGRVEGKLQEIVPEYRPTA
jgi:hypothetical protein